MVNVPKLPAQDDAADLAKQLQNPVAALISVPFQSNFDWGGGPEGDGFQYKLNIQPVVPIGLNDDWNLISRTILPYIYQEDVIGWGSQSGLSDTVQSLFFSPKAPTATGWIWGAGPVFLIPTATDDLLGGEKWGAGPTALILRQEKGWTYGILANHLWSYAGEDARDEVNATFLQPFLSYTSASQTTVGLNLESTYDWEHGQWTVPVNLALSQLVKIGGAPVQFQLGGRYYAEGPGNGPEWGLRFGVTLLFPK
ncbi:MAG: transporter [Akkermansiaceae bacterium]|nr:transporter [Verrucomicrobiae bacterium]MCP5552058.1 transporter [Akkermansiaceae bacterium]